MNELVELLAAFMRITSIPLLGYTIVRLARRWPYATLTLLLAIITSGAGALAYVGQDGFGVALDTRQMTFHSEAGRWCFTLGGLAVLLGVPALPLVAIARARQGEHIGPVGPQWVGVLFGYFMACLIWSGVLYSLLTGINK